MPYTPEKPRTEKQLLQRISNYDRRISQLERELEVLRVQVNSGPNFTFLSGTAGSTDSQISVVKGKITNVV